MGGEMSAIVTDLSGAPEPQLEDLVFIGQRGGEKSPIVDVWRLIDDETGNLADERHLAFAAKRRQVYVVGWIYEVSVPRNVEGVKRHDEPIFKGYFHDQAKKS